MSLHCIRFCLSLSCLVSWLGLNATALPAEGSASLAKAYSQSACSAKFWTHSNTHTACLLHQDSPPSADMSDLDKQLIVDLHNKYRANVEQQPGQPTAADMQTMVWDDELASLAAKWSRLCIFEHDRGIDRTIPGSYEVGQNLGMGHVSWTHVITRWWQEGAVFAYGSPLEAANKPSTGHYVQLVWASSSRVGCASTVCPAGHYYACNYAHAAGIGSQRQIPYQQGQKGSACPMVYNASSGLCDCKGKICKNDGVLDLRTCQCKCPSRVSWLEDWDCSVDCSLAQDRKICSSKGGSWDMPFCQTYGNVKYEYCPVMCGVCPAKTRPLEVALDPHSTPASQIMLQAAASSPTSEDPEAESEEGDGHDDEDGSDPNDDESDDNEPEAEADEDDGDMAPEEEDYEGEDLPRCRAPDHPSCIAVTAAASAERGADPEPDQCQRSSSKCPAMCGQCTATMCRDADGKARFVGDTWLTEKGLHTCSSQGVSVSRGCVTANQVDVIPIMEEKNETWNGVVYHCTCGVLSGVPNLRCTPLGKVTAESFNAASNVPADLSTPLANFEEYPSVTARIRSSSQAADMTRNATGLHSGVETLLSIPSPRPPAQLPPCRQQDPPFCGSIVFSRLSPHMRCGRTVRCPAACGHCALVSGTALPHSTPPHEGAAHITLPPGSHSTAILAVLASDGSGGSHDGGETFRPSTTSPTDHLTDDGDESGPGPATACSSPDPARCGQPSARGFFLPSQCRHVAVQRSCPAMCRTCSASTCLDYSGHQYALGDVWVSDFAQMTCTPGGVIAEKGCYFAQLRQFISAGSMKNFSDGMLHYSCTCAIDDGQTTLDCTRIILTKGSVSHLLPRTPPPPIVMRSPTAGNQRPTPTHSHRYHLVSTSTPLPLYATPSHHRATPSHSRPWVSLSQGDASLSFELSSSHAASATAASRQYLSDVNGASTPAGMLRRQQPEESSASTISSAAAMSAALQATAAVTVTQRTCGQPEEAKCGQPSATGYYAATQCRHPTVLRMCPSMCGQCQAISCKDYAGKVYGVMQSWVSPGFGRMTCTTRGVSVEDGCYFKSRDAFVPTNKTYDYTERGMALTCLCERVTGTQLRMSCKTKP